MKQITYATTRLVDWVACIKVGAATVKVHFTGGALTKYGVTPAEYTTSDPFIQRVIEQSQYFKEGRITKIRLVDIPELKSTNPTPAPTPVPVAVVPAPAPVAVPAPTPITEQETATLTQVEASCLQDAQDYLQQNFGIPSHKVRTWDAAKQKAAENGVEFVKPNNDKTE